MEGHLHAKSFGGTCNWLHTRGACLIEVAATAGGTVLSIEGQGHFLTLAQGRVHTKIQTGFSQKLLCRSEPNFV